MLLLDKVVKAEANKTKLYTIWDVTRKCTLQKKNSIIDLEEKNESLYATDLYLSSGEGLDG
jgi:hypothetical protein